LPAEALRQATANFGPAVQTSAAEVYASAEIDLAAQQAQLEQALASLGQGDVRRGQALFQSKRLACSACHAMGYLGGRIGPDLTHVGRIRTERDLLESILFPSASFVRSYEPVTVLTFSGQTVSGLVVRDTSEEMVLATGVDTQVRIARDEIEEVWPGKVSIMPAGLDKLLTPQELADLVAFLKAAQ
jgi:putative heme-binding domain-containing protein